MAKSLIDAINEQISWKGLTVRNKNKVILPRGKLIIEHDEFEPGTRFECITDKDDIILIMRENNYYNAPKDWFYIKD